MSNQELIFNALMLNSPVAIVTLDQEGKVSTCNPAFEKLFGYSYDEVIGEYLDILISSPETYYETTNYTKRILSFGETIRVTGKRRKKDETPIHVEIQGFPIFTEGKQAGILALYHDITDRVRAEESSRDLYNTLVHTMDSIDADVYVADMHNFQILFANQHIRKSFGDNLIGKTCWEVFRHDSQPCSVCTNSKLLDSNGRPVGSVVWEGQNPITKRWYKNFDRAIAWGDGSYVRLQVATDITDNKEAQERLFHLAHFDPLTDLPNRKYFLDCLEEMAKSANQEKFAVVFLDIDDFKSVNDQFGHGFGDQLLVEVSRRMKNCLRDGDKIARVSGDEFSLILTNLPSKTIVPPIIERLIEEVASPYLIAEKRLQITVSAGISFYPDDGLDGEQLLKRADEAMYHIKRSGKNNYSFYEEHAQSPLYAPEGSDSS